MRSVELFAGAGGLALGCELAGFHSEAVVEWNQWACDTLRENQANGYPLVVNWDIRHGDVRAVDWSGIPEGIDLVTGGPPCQPFSSGGKGRAADDPRDMFPATADVIRQLRPKAFIVENVKGLTRSAFANYFAYIQLRLQHPEIVAHPDESWGDHHARLQAEHTTVSSDLRYNLVTTLVNAADYGVPQQRHRVFMVGFRADLEAEWQFPEPTHSYERLIHEQYVSGEYWERNGVKATERGVLPARRLQSQERLDQQGERQAWRTVREALQDLPTPTARGSRTYLNHLLQPGARQYPGHTGSPVDLPAKALKAGGHGVPGGENMALFPNGTVRYFSVRESARLQTFPDRWELHGSWGEAMRQLGNAVPVLLAEKVARSVHEHLALAIYRAQAARAVTSRRASA